MKKIRASEFKARCLHVMKQVNATGEQVVVTKRGSPLVRVVPIKDESDELFGFMAAEVAVVGDVESPVVPLKDWKVTRK